MVAFNVLCLFLAIMFLQNWGWATSGLLAAWGRSSLFLLFAQNTVKFVLLKFSGKTGRGLMEDRKHLPEMCFYSLVPKFAAKLNDILKESYLQS